MRPRIRAHEILLYRICSVGRSTFPLTDLRKTFEAKRKNFMTAAMFVSLAWLLFAAPLGYLHAQDLPYKGKTVRVIAGFPSGVGSDAVGRPLFAPRNTPRPTVQSLRDAFAKLEGDKDFMAELRKVGGDDADLLLAKDAEPVLRQVLTVSPGVQEFVKTITKKHLQR
jgi:hypothetical protein